MPTKRQVKISSTVILFREIRKEQGDIIAWSVVEYLPEKTNQSGIRRGIIVKRKNYWYPKEVGHRMFSRLYWIGYGIFPIRYVAGLTRAEVISKLLEK